MRTEYGIFSDEGLLEADFYSEAEAQKCLDEDYADDDARVSLICPEHGEELDTCEGCLCEE